MYNLNSDYTDLQFLYIDLMILFPIVFFMALTNPADYLTHKVPFTSLLSAPVILSIIGQCLIHVSILFGVLGILKLQEWYFPIIIHIYNGGEIDCSYENTTLFLFSNIQYISTLFAYNIAKPFMQPLYTNITLCLWVFVSI